MFDLWKTSLENILETYSEVHGMRMHALRTCYCLSITKHKTYPKHTNSGLMTISTVGLPQEQRVLCGMVFGTNQLSKRGAVFAMPINRYSFEVRRGATSFHPIGGSLWCLGPSKSSEGEAQVVCFCHYFWSLSNWSLVLRVLYIPYTF